MGREVFFKIPQELFSDPDGDEIFFSAYTSDKKPLPHWLKFDEKSL